MRPKSLLFYKLVGRYTSLSNQHTSAAFFTGSNLIILRDLRISMYIYIIPLLFILCRTLTCSLYPRGLATYRPSDGAYIAFLTSISGFSVWGIVEITPVFGLFYPVLQFDILVILATFTPSSVTSPEIKKLYIPLTQKG